MSNKLVLIAAGIGISVAAGAGIMVAVDNAIDTQLAQIDQSLPSNVVLNTLEDTNTFSQRTLSQQFTVGNIDQNFGFLVNTLIKKRPWGASLEHEVFLESGLEALTQSEEAKQFFTTYFVDQPLISGSTQVGLTGNYGTVLNGLTIDDNVDGFDVSLASLLVTAQGNVKSGDANITGNWKGASMTELAESGDMNATILPVKWDYNGRFIDATLFIGEQNLYFDGFTYNDTNAFDENVKFEIGKMASESFSEINDNELIAESTIDIASMFVEGDAHPIAFEEINLNVGLSGINIDNLRQLSDALNNLPANGEPDAATMRELNTLLQNGLAIDINNFALKVDGAPLTSVLNIALAQNEIADLNNPFSLMGLVGELTANVNVNANKALLDSPVMSDVLQGVIGNGLMIENADDLTLNFNLKDGAATLNGEALPLPF